MRSEYSEWEDMLFQMWTSCTCSYFNQSSGESDDGGESEDMVKQRIAKEFRYAEDRDATKESGSEEEEEEEDDPLEAFMAGIEVTKLCESSRLLSFGLVSASISHSHYATV